MAADRITSLTAALTTDKELREEFLAATSHEEAAALAVRKGWDVSAADVEAIAGALSKPGGDELSEAELESISGGRAQAHLNSGGVNPIAVSRERSLGSS